MALTNVEVVRLLIGLTPANPFHDYLTDEEIQWFIDYCNGDLVQAARMAAISLSLALTSVNTREITGDIHVYNDIARAYTVALDNFIKDSGSASIPSGLLGYAAGISYEDVCANDRNPDNVRPGLIGIRLCDGNVFSYTNPFRIKSYGC
jgi:hypothetical protein